LLSLTAYVVFAAPIYQYNYQTAAQIKTNPIYEAALLKRDAEGKFISVSHLIRVIYQKPNTVVKRLIQMRI
jgi:hypothetical protein